MARKKERYGAVWGSKGRLEVATRCIQHVWGKYRDRQCSRERGHGPDGLYCKQHAKKLEVTE